MDHGCFQQKALICERRNGREKVECIFAQRRDWKGKTISTPPMTNLTLDVIT